MQKVNSIAGRQSGVSNLLEEDDDMLCTANSNPLSQICTSVFYFKQTDSVSKTNLWSAVLQL